MTRSLFLHFSGFFWITAACLTGTFSIHAQGPKAAKSRAESLVVGNEEGKLTTLSQREWKKLARHKVEVKGRDGTMVRYEGIRLADVLRLAGVPFDGHLRGRRVANYVLIEAADGYRAVFALAEVDPGVAEKTILLADRQGGKPLPESVGPYRLIVPGDKIHSRWVRQVVRITVQHPPESKDQPAPKN
jgi:DMSO/TMAO reductase YedYZ molybdopterin-dependent catalytic subunit